MDQPLEPQATLSQSAVTKRTVWQRIFALRRNLTVMIGASILIFWVIMAIIAPLIVPYGINEIDSGQVWKPPSAAHAFGTDNLGRDVFSRMLNGSYISLTVGFIAVAVSLLIGVTVGAVSGYLGGWVDTVLMRVTDVFLAFPRLILALAFVSALGPGIENAVIAIAFTAWPPYARVARAETLTIRRSDFIAAIRLQGASPLRILLGHVVPLCTSSLIVRVGLDMAGIILTAAGLGFLGLGAQPPAPEWGAMIASGRRFLLDQWWVATMPGIAILVVSLGFNLLGDGLRDILDPKVG